MTKEEIEKDLEHIIEEFEHFSKILDRDTKESKRKTLSERIDLYLKKVSVVNDSEGI